MYKPSDASAQLHQMLSDNNAYLVGFKYPLTEDEESCLNGAVKMIREWQDKRNFVYEDTVFTNHDGVVYIVESNAIRQLDHPYKQPEAVPLPYTGGEPPEPAPLPHTGKELPIIAPL